LLLEIFGSLHVNASSTENLLLLFLNHAAAKGMHSSVITDRVQLRIENPTAVALKMYVVITTEK
jgi:hypothetical protein